MAKYSADSFIRNPSIDPTGKFMGMNNLPTIPVTLDDEPYTITEQYDERPDLLAHVLYGSSKYWYVFALRNPDELKDPIRDFKAGVNIILPSVRAVQR